jgi:hypothetical protein
MKTRDKILSNIMKSDKDSKDKAKTKNKKKREDIRFSL